MQRKIAFGDLEGYRRHVMEGLCWRDGAATHGSSGLQRQCPRCRTKWSFAHLETELRLFEEFVFGRSASDASRLVGCAKNTALKHFRAFHAAVEDIIRVGLVEGGIATNPQNLPELRSLERALRAGGALRRNRVCRHLFFHSFTLEERSRALFKRHMVPKALQMAGLDIPDVPVPHMVRQLQAPVEFEETLLETTPRDMDSPAAPPPTVLCSPPPGTRPSVHFMPMGLESSRTRTHPRPPAKLPANWSEVWNILQDILKK